MALALAGLRIFESQSHGFQAKPKPEHHYIHGSRRSQAHFCHKLSTRNPFQSFKRTPGLLLPESASTEHRVKGNFDEQASRNPLVRGVSAAAHVQTGQFKLSMSPHLNCPIGRVMSNDNVDYYKVDLGSSSVDSLCLSPALQPSLVKHPVPRRPSRPSRDRRAPSAQKEPSGTVAFGPPRMASAPSAKPRPLRARIPGSDAFRAVHAIALVVLEPHGVRDLFIHAHHALAPSAGPIFLGGKIRRTTRFPHSCTCARIRRRGTCPARSAALWVCTALGRVVRIAVPLLLVECWRAGGGGWVITLGSRLRTRVACR